MLVTQSCPMLCNARDCSSARLLCPWNSPDRNTGMGSHSLIQGIFLTQGSNWGLLPCRQILYQLSHQRHVKPCYSRPVVPGGSRRGAEPSVDSPLWTGPEISAQLGHNTGVCLCICVVMGLCRYMSLQLQIYVFISN